tara:strand:- start:635 stop:1000 length:366 start_codon:yes stop_codon:yes gene_type:complete
MKSETNTENETYEAEVIDSTIIDEGILKNVLLRAGRTIALPALQAFEMIIDTKTPAQARVSMIAALTYLLMPIDLVPDLIPVAGFSDDLVALTAVMSLWSNHITPEIKQRARQKLDRWLPL